jgi:Tol biopolymer transport system component
LRCVACLVLALGFAATALPASFPPDFHFRSVSTDRVVVHYHEGLEAQAREAAALATEILAAHEARYHGRVGRVHIVIADTNDQPNGFATPFPYSLVRINVVAPAGTDEFGNHDGWLRLVLTHELAHVVHLEEARGIVGGARKVLGRAPYLFPNSLTPSWLIEGLATFEETEGTAFGRGRNPDVRMYMRSASLGNEFLGEDQAIVGLDRWPDGQGAYFYGEAFLRDLSNRFGSETLPELARVHSGRIIPYTDELTSNSVTGGPFYLRWREWRESARWEFAREARRIEQRGLSESTPLTSRGVRQAGPRFSPDGEWIAYSSRTLTRFGALRIVRRDGSADRYIADRNGGSASSWTPDGRHVVFDELEVHDLFSTWSDLRIADVATGRVRKLTRGLRARDPDVSADGRTVVFVRELGPEAELDLMERDGSGLRTLVPTAPGVEWSGPRWSPRGDAIVASRLAPGGWLDLVRVDPVSGEVVELTHDRAKDVEPAWTPDGSHIVFRSDRDGVSNLYALRLSDGVLLRVTNVLGGAFNPDVAPDGRSVAFSSYGAGGYDLRTMELDTDALASAEPFSDPYPESRPDPPPVEGPDRPYRPLPTLLPRFWTPYVSGLFSDGETKLGVATAAVDPLFRHAWGLDLHRGSETGRFGFHGYYQYDRFRPTYSVTAEDTTDPQGGDARLRTRQLTLRGALPLSRSFHRAQSLSVAWRRERQTSETARGSRSFDAGGIEVAWTMNGALQYPYTISPVEGWQSEVAVLKEAPFLGSDVSLVKTTADVRAYKRMFGESGALALRIGGGTTFGEPGFNSPFAVGGFPDGSLFDLVGTRVFVLRGFPDSAFVGRNVVAANAECRFPLAHPQRGYRSFPVFVRHLHGSTFLDLGQAWSEGVPHGGMKAGLGVALGGDFVIGHYLPLTGVVGVARGLGDRGETRVYFRTGLAF